MLIRSFKSFARQKSGDRKEERATDDWPESKSFPLLARDNKADSGVYESRITVPLDLITDEYDEEDIWKEGLSVLANPSDLVVLQ